MEIYGPFLQEDESYVEEIRIRKDFNNIHLRFPKNHKIDVYNRKCIMDLEGRVELKEYEKRKDELAEEITKWANKNRFDFSKYTPNFTSSHPEYQHDFVPLYLHLRKSGFTSSEICA